MKTVVSDTLEKNGTLNRIKVSAAKVSVKWNVKAELRANVFSILNESKLPRQETIPSLTPDRKRSTF